MTTNIELRLLNDKDEVLCKLDAVTYYNNENEFDAGETFYIHPMTGSECQTVDQCFIGWKDQNEEEQKHWNILKDRIESDKDKEQYFADEVSKNYYI